MYVSILLLYKAVGLIMIFSTSWAAKYSPAKMQGYDKSINLFDPNGDILQVEYAGNAASNGQLLLCMTTTDGSIVLGSPSTRFSPLLDRRCLDKVSQVDDGIWIATAGLLGDSKYVVREARNFCVSFRARYGYKPSVEAVANHVGSFQHQASVRGDQRPLGLHVLCIGYSTKSPLSGEILSVEEEQTGQQRERIIRTSAMPCVYLVTPSGQVTEWRGIAVGKNAARAMKMLESKLESATQAVHESDAVDIVCEILSQLSSQPFSTEEKQEKEGKEENKGNKGKESNKSLPSSASQTLKPKSKSSNKSGAGVANANDDSGGYHDLIIMRRRALVTAHSVHTGAGEIEMTSSSSDDDDNDNNHRGGEDSNNKISYSSHNTRLGYNEEDDDYGSESYTVVKMRKRI